MCLSRNCRKSKGCYLSSLFLKNYSTEEAIKYFYKYYLIFSPSQFNFSLWIDKIRSISYFNRRWSFN